MDLALARRSGQALHNNYTITNSPALAPLRFFLRAAVRNLTSAYENRGYAPSEEDTKPSICSQMRLDMSQESHGDIASTYLDQGYEIPEVESLSPLRPKKITLMVLVGARTTFPARANFFFYFKK